MFCLFIHKQPGRSALFHSPSTPVEFLTSPLWSEKPDPGDPQPGLGHMPSASSGTRGPTPPGPGPARHRQGGRAPHRKKGVGEAAQREGPAYAGHLARGERTESPPRGFHLLGKHHRRDSLPGSQTSSYPHRCGHNSLLWLLLADTQCYPVSSTMSSL